MLLQKHARSVLGHASLVRRNDSPDFVKYNYKYNCGIPKLKFGRIKAELSASVFYFYFFSKLRITIQLTKIIVCHCAQVKKIKRVLQFLCKRLLISTKNLIKIFWSYLPSLRARQSIHSLRVVEGSGFHDQASLNIYMQTHKRKSNQNSNIDGIKKKGFNSGALKSWEKIKHLFFTRENLLSINKVLWISLQWNLHGPLLKSTVTHDGQKNN